MHEILGVNTLVIYVSLYPSGLCRNSHIEHAFIQGYKLLSIFYSSVYLQALFSFFHFFPPKFISWDVHVIFWESFRYASEGPLKGILGYTDEDVVSNDFVGDSR